MSLEIDASGRWILSHAICRWCGRPSWDHFPGGVVADRYRCAYCGCAQNDPDLALLESARIMPVLEARRRLYIEEDAREVRA